MAYELKEENIEEFLSSFRSDEMRRDRLLDEIYIPSSVGRDNDTNDDLLALTQRKYILTHDDGLVDPLYAVKNLAVFALRHEMSDRLTFVENPLTMKDNPTLSEAREYIRQFDRVAADKYKGGVEGLEEEVKRKEELIAKLYEEGYKYDRVNSVNLFSNINNRLYGRRDRLRFYPIGRPQKQGKIFNNFDEVYKFYERIHTMGYECKWHCPTAEAGEKMFARINTLAEEFNPSGEWGISITEDGKTITLYDEDKAELEDLLPFISEELKKEEQREFEKEKVKVTGISRSVGHITGMGTAGDKQFRFDLNTTLGTITLDGIDEKYAKQVKDQIEDMQKKQQENKKKNNGLVRK